MALVLVSQLLRSLRMKQDGIVSDPNSQVRAAENSRSAFNSRHQHRFSTHLWAGTLGNRLIALNVDRAFLSQHHSQHSVGLTGRCPLGEKSVYVVCA
jgi:hypothetical protein